MVAEQQDIYMQNNEAGPSSHTIYKNKLKTYQRKGKTLRRKQSSNSLLPWVDYSFLDMILKVHMTIEKLDTLKLLC